MSWDVGFELTLKSPLGTVSGGTPLKSGGSAGDVGSPTHACMMYAHV